MRSATGRHWPTVGMWVQLLPLSPDVSPRWGVILNLDARGLSLISIGEGEDPLPVFYPWSTIAEVSAYRPSKAQRTGYDVWQQEKTT